MELKRVQMEVKRVQKWFKRHSDFQRNAERDLTFKLEVAESRVLQYKEAR